MYSSSPAIEWLKVSWMTLWRIILVTAFTLNFLKAVLISMTVASIVVFLMKRSVKTFPLLRLIAFKNPFVRLTSRSAPNPKFTKTSENRLYKNKPLTPVLQDTRTYIEKATHKGKSSPYQPYLLDRIQLQRSPWIVGDPGFGLDKSGFAQESIAAGQAGEINFAKALQKAKLLDNFQSFWSVAMPDRDFFGPSTVYDTDIDCVLFDGRTIYLVDLKNYKGGDVTYTLEAGAMVCIDNTSKQYIRLRSNKQTKNMSMAKELIEKHVAGRGYRVKAVVVLMPQNSGGPEVKNLTWPGNIPAYSLESFLKELQQSKGFDTTKDHRWIGSRLAGLVKK